MGEYRDGVDLNPETVDGGAIWIHRNVLPRRLGGVPKGLGYAIDGARGAQERRNGQDGHG